VDLPDRLSSLPRRELDAGLVVVEATTFAARLRGLAGLPALGPEVGLHFPRCRCIHTFGMRFALDLVWLDGAGAVVRIDRDVPGRRQRSARRARSVLEVAAGRGDAFAQAGLTAIVSSGGAPG
jgi:uncharacterized membrane protein (UPF0127 family)